MIAITEVFKLLNDARFTLHNFYMWDKLEPSVLTINFTQDCWMRVKGNELHPIEDSSCCQDTCNDTLYINWNEDGSLILTKRYIAESTPQISCDESFAFYELKDIVELVIGLRSGIIKVSHADNKAKLYVKFLDEWVSATFDQVVELVNRESHVSLK